MKNSSILIILFLLSLLSSKTVHAQSVMQEFLSQTRLELGAGWHTTMAPTSNTSGSEYASFNSYYGGMHYALNETWGVRGTYAYHNFEHKDFSERDLIMHKLMLEITYSLGSAISGNNYYSELNNFDVLAHGGFGASLMKREMNSGSDWVSNIQLGLMPTYKIGDVVSVHLDFAYVINSGQNYTFSGVYNTGTKEAFFTANLGVSVALGR